MMRRRKLPYDRALTVFSPDGRLFQLEYALETVKRGSPVVGVVCSSAAILATKVERVKLRSPDYMQKIHQIDDHIGVGVSGLSGDARVLVDKARIEAQRSRLLYDEPIKIEVLSKNMGSLMQQYTQRARTRPFGVSLIFAGADEEEAKVFLTGPSGESFSYNAVAIGEGEEEIMQMLETEYEKDVTVNNALSLVVKCLREVTKDALEPSNIKIAKVLRDTKEFRELEISEISRYF